MWPQSKLDPAAAVCDNTQTMTIGRMPLPRARHLPLFPRLVVAHLEAAGFTHDVIFEGLGFSKTDLATDSFRLEAAQHARFINRAIALTGNLHLAVDMKDHAFDATSNAVLILFATSGRISKALRLITRYNHIYTRTLTARLAEQNGQPVLNVESHLKDEKVNYFALSCFVLFIDGFFKDALNGQHLVRRAELALSEPIGFDQVRDRFGLAIKFDCDQTRIYLDPELIDAPLRQADPQTTKLITAFCEQQLAALDAEMTIAGAVSALIYEQISTVPSLDEAAAILGLSSRSLRRHLRAAGTTYQSLLNAARMDLAIKLLTETDEPVSAIAYEIGFEHPSHFGRAFKQWTGQAPSSYRQAHS